MDRPSVDVDGRKGKLCRGLWGLLKVSEMCTLQYVKSVEDDGARKQGT